MAGGGELLKPIADYLSALALALTTGIVGAGKRTRDRSLQNKRQLQGDPDDPNAEGVLEIAKRTEDRVEALDDDVDDLKRMVTDVHEDVINGNDYRRNGNSADD
jgi:hypothetical protein